MGDSDIDVSFKSTSDAENIVKITRDIKQMDRFSKTDSFTQSDRPSDGYETCMDDSLSEDNKNTIKSNLIGNLGQTKLNQNSNKVQNVNTKTYSMINTTNDIEDLTPTNSRVNFVTDQIFLDVPDNSEKAYTPTGKLITSIYFQT